jgi:hypothetical protein
LTKCGDLSEAEVEGTETSAVAVKMAVAVDVIDTAAVTIMRVALTVKTAATLKTTTVTVVMS